MSELNLNYQYCCITRKYCLYNTGVQEGYLLGILTIIITILIMECVLEFTDTYDENNKEKKDN